MMASYRLVDDLLGPIRRVAMPRAARLYATGGTAHVVARCNNREFYFTTTEDCGLHLILSRDPMGHPRDSRTLPVPRPDPRREPAIPAGPPTGPYGAPRWWPGISPRARRRIDLVPSHLQPLGG